MKKILIFYGAYGGGHLSAAKAIKNYIDSNYPDCETMMVDCVEYINKYLNKLSPLITSSPEVGSSRIRKFGL